MKFACVRFEWLSLVAAVMLAACSSSSIVKTYDGESLPVKKIAVLTVPENINLISVNGKPVKKYLLDLNVKYGLQPGVNSVVFEYGSVWALTSRDGEDGPRSEKITSAPREVVIAAKAGGQLSFRYESASNIREARILASGFEADIVDSLNNVLAKSGDLRGQQADSSSQLPMSKAEKTDDPYTGSNMETVDTPMQTNASDLPTIDALKVLWGSATTKEKKDFLKWAFQ